MHPAEGSNVSVLHQPVGVQGLPGFHDQRRRQRERVDLRHLLLKGKIIAFHELRVDAGDVGVLVPTVIDHKIDAAIQRVMLVQRFLGRMHIGDGRFQLRALERAGLAIVEYTQAYLFARIEEWPQEFFERDIQGFHTACTSSQQVLKYRMGIPRCCAFSISTAMPRLTVLPNTHSSLQRLMSTMPMNRPRSRCS